MINYLYYYYGISIDNLQHLDDNYYFVYNNSNYCLKKCCNLYSLINYDELYNYLININYYVYRPIYNKKNSIITRINGCDYILYKINESDFLNIKSDKLVNIHYLRYVKNSLFLLNKFNWINSWQKKIDYFEEKINLCKNNINNFDFFSVFNFFIGISENSIVYLKNVYLEEKKQFNDEICVQHRRLRYDCNYIYYYDLFEIVFDHCSRDICEYIKSCVVDGNYDINLLNRFILDNNLSRFGLRILYSRLFFPSFFFDFLENINFSSININIENMKLCFEKYILFLKKVNIFFKNEYRIPIINWL